MILAIDPGTEVSAWVLLDGETPGFFGIDGNQALIGMFSDCSMFIGDKPLFVTPVIEMIASYGMPVGRTTFETVLWIGRFAQALGLPANDSWKVYRKDVKLHLCNSPRANDASIRQAIIDRYGGREKGIGNKKTHGPLYGVSKDIWSALAVGLYWLDTRPSE